MNSFQWNTNFETGIAEVDDQHRRLVDIINAYGDHLSEGALDLPGIQSVFDDLVSYALEHFQDEEDLMKRRLVDHRHTERHIREHADFLADVKTMRSGLDVERLEDLKHLLDFLIHWLAFHILGADQNMARQIAAIDEGGDPSEAYVMEEVKSSKSTEPLIVALNNLFDLLTTRNRELVRLNETLEKKVAERTRALSEANTRLEELSLTDVLTGLHNRRYAMRSLEALWDESSKLKRPIGTMMIDADSFKEVNDNYGHDAGDHVLVELSRCLSDHLRTDDVLCRLGGDEFFVICPNTDAEGLFHAAESIHSAVGNLDVPVGNGHWRGSISIGMAVRTDQMDTHEQLVTAADRGVYAAKAAGRNCARFDPEIG